MSNGQPTNADLDRILSRPGAQWFPDNHVEQLRNAATGATFELIATRDLTGLRVFELVCTQSRVETFRSLVNREQWLPVFRSTRPYVPQLLRLLGQPTLADAAAGAAPDPKVQLEGVFVGPVSLEVWVESQARGATDNPRYTVLAHIDRGARTETWEAAVSEMAIVEAYANSLNLLASAATTDLTFTLKTPASLSSSLLFASALADVERMEIRASVTAPTHPAKPKKTRGGL